MIEEPTKILHFEIHPLSPYCLGVLTADNQFKLVNLADDDFEPEFTT